MKSPRVTKMSKTKKAAVFAAAGAVAKQVAKELARQGWELALSGRSLGEVRLYCLRRL